MTIFKKVERLNFTQEDFITCNANNVSIDAFINEKYSNELQDENFMGLTGFDAVLYSRGLCLKSNLEKGVRASTVAEVLGANQLPTNKMSIGGSEHLFKVVVDRVIRKTVIADSGLMALINSTIMSAGSNYTAMYFDFADGTKNGKNTELERTTAGAAIPEAEIVLGDNSIRLYKYARMMKIPYEALLETTIDVFLLWVETVAKKLAKSQAVRATEVLLSGDGNSGTAAVASDYTIATANKIGASDILGLVFEYYNTYGVAPNRFITDVNGAMALSNVLSDLGVKNGVVAPQSITLRYPQIKFEDIQVIISENAKLAKGGNVAKIAVYNVANGVNRIMQIGGTIRETDNKIENQIKMMTFSEIANFMSIGIHGGVQLRTLKNPS